MKKNIGFIPMDSALEEWLLEKLMKEPPESDCAKDLLSGIRDMLSGEVASPQALGRNAGASLLLMGLTTALGLGEFRRKDLR